MGIQYYLRETELNGNPFISGRVKYSGNTDMDRFVAILGDKGSTLTETDIRAVIELMTKAIADELKQGRRVTLPFGKFGVSVKGAFESINASFDSSVNEVRLTIAGGLDLQKILATGVSVERIEIRDRRPKLLKHLDVVSKEINTIVTGGRVVTLDGTDLSLNPEQADEGVFYINQADKSELQVTEYVKIQPRELIYTAPAVVAGTDYDLEFRRRYSSDEMVVGVLKKAILKGA